MKLLGKSAGLVLCAALWVLPGAGRGTGAGDVNSKEALLEKPTVRGQISIALPRGWVVGKEQGAHPLLVAQAPPENVVGPDGGPGGIGGRREGGGGLGGEGRFQANLFITVDPAGEKIDAAHQQQVAANDHSQYTDYRAVEKPTPVEKGATKGVMFGGTFRRGNLKLRSRQYLFSVDGKLYGITFTCLESSWQRYEGLLDASVATFTVK